MKALNLPANTPLIKSKHFTLLRDVSRKVLVLVALMLATKALILQSLLCPKNQVNFLAGAFGTNKPFPPITKAIRTIVLEEKDLQAETKVAWAYHRSGFVRYGSSIGGVGLPIAAAATPKDSSDSDALIREQFERVCIHCEQTVCRYHAGCMHIKERKMLG